MFGIPLILIVIPLVPVAAYVLGWFCFVIAMLWDANDHKFGPRFSKNRIIMAMALALVWPWVVFKRDPLKGGKTSVKGWELYIWEKDCETYYSLLTGTNRMKTEVEITRAKVKAIAAIQNKLNRLKMGQSIIMWGRRWGQEPPDNAAEVIREYCKKIGLKVVEKP